MRSRTTVLRLAAPLALAAALVASTLSACTSSSDTKTITVYSGRTEALIRPLLERFSKETGIGVDFKAGDSADLALLLGNEGDKTPADVFISQTPGATAYLEDKGLLQPVAKETLDRVGPDYRSDSGMWVGLSGRVRTLVYNTDLVDETSLPVSVFDLTKPEYKGKVGLAPTNGSFQDFVSAMRAEKGDEQTRTWLAGMAANEATTYANNTAIVEAVGRGEVEMGLVNHYYNVRAEKENPAVKSRNYFFPNRDLGSLLLVTTASITKSSSRTAEAERLVQFLLSDESQKYFADETQEYPLVAGVQPSDKLVPLAEIQTDTIDLSSLGGGLETTIEEIKASGLTS